MGIWAGGVEAGAGDTLKLTLMPVMSNKKGLFMNKTGQLRKTRYLSCLSSLCSLSATGFGGAPAPWFGGLFSSLIFFSADAC